MCNDSMAMMTTPNIPKMTSDGRIMGSVAPKPRQPVRLLWEQPKGNAISGVAMLKVMAAIEESWTWAGGLQDCHFSVLDTRIQQNLRCGLVLRNTVSSVTSSLQGAFYSRNMELKTRLPSFEDLYRTAISEWPKVLRLPVRNA